MTIEDIPTWVPEAARRLIITAHVDNPFLQRFLKDPRMEDVWNALKLMRPVQGGIKAVDPDGMVSCIDFDVTDFPSEMDFACAAFCWTVVETTGDTWEGKPIARVESQLNKIAKPYDDLIERCDFLKRNEIFWSIPVPDDIAAAADKISQYAARMATLIKQREKPFILKRSSRERGEDDAVRGWAIRIADGMLKLWGRIPYSNLATTVEVLFELEHDPERRDAVKKWCQDLSGK